MGEVYLNQNILRRNHEPLRILIKKPVTEKRVSRAESGSGINSVGGKLL
jgi:hypothetical protein